MWVIRKNWQYWVIMIGLVMAGISGCQNQKPIRIGVSFELTGKNGNLGVQARNGVELAVETLNAAGGIQGRPIQLVIRDDQGMPEQAKAVDRELINEGVVAIIGHITSAQTLAAYSVTEQAGIVLISPTASSPELSGKQDHFFRVVAPNPKEGAVLAAYCFERQKYQRLAVMYDTDNAAFTRSLLDAFTKNATALNGQIVGEIGFSSSASPDFSALLADVQALQPDALLLLVSPVDTALIAQQRQMRGWTIPLVATAWAQSPELLHKGGEAADGIVIPLAYDPNNTSPAYQEFKTRYVRRFGETPTLYAGNGYDIVLILAAALTKTAGRAGNLAKTLVEIEAVQGVAGPVKFDIYGEIARDWFLLEVKDGEFRSQGTLRAP
ncbi:extracellular ligand-binding receptor [Candidatus Moduliflexus flocculans]|uniref:Extracellular ligand-binding receptor n=1 Tax=Candidatus Moduliflexus flocculans TaxID=1499966 RepID=A0A081BP77_9BACT|nr:extracellular ligand-binding receptor [Candidatus Moduliflexus flocculans]